MNKIVFGTSEMPRGGSQDLTGLDPVLASTLLDRPISLFFKGFMERVYYTSIAKLSGAIVDTSMRDKLQHENL